MRRTALLPLCLLTTLGCQGRYLLGAIGDAGAGGSSTSDDSAGGSGRSGMAAAGGRAGAGTAGADATSSTGGSGQTQPQFDCNAVASQQFDTACMQAYVESPEVSSAVDSIISAMTPADKASQMCGVDGSPMDYQDIERSPDVSVAGVGTIRGFNYRDGDHGVNLDEGQKNRVNDGNDFATVFPTTSVRAASWDLDLEKRVGEALGDETAASLNNVLLAPCVNVIRHPYWGRTQESYGEDMYSIGRMASAFTVGLQEYVTGCATHFAANNIEKYRSTQNAIMNEQTLREIYGRHFEMVVQDGGIGCVMASYNKINGIKNTQNYHLLRDVLKAPIAQGGFGFQGFVISDWWAMPGDQTPQDATTMLSVANEALQAGLDVELPWTLHYSTSTLSTSVQSLVEEAAKRVLAQKLRFKSAMSSDGWSVKAPTSKLSNDSIAASTDHEALAEEVELKSAVLLANGPPSAPVLPLTRATNIAVVGPDVDFSVIASTVPKSCSSADPRTCTFHFATDPAFGDRGSSRVNGDPARSIGPFAGIQAAAGSGATVTSGNSADAAANADTVVVVVGYTPGDEGEEYAVASGGDRFTLDLPNDQNAFVTSLLDLMKPTIIVVESGSIVNLPWLSHANKNQATVWAGYGGLRGGAALGKLLFAAGGANFSGKMPLAWPTQSELDVAPFKDSDTQTTMGYFFGYREYDRRKAAGMSPNLVFPFGHGLSYSTFEYSNLQVPCTTVSANAIVNVTVDIKNTSSVDGDETALLFLKPPPKPANISGDRPVKELKSFARVSVKAGRTVTAQLPVRIRDLRRWEGDAGGKWVIDTGVYQLLVGKDADDAETATNQGTLMVQGS